ncbi:MAG: Mur ligase family protein [Bacillota bacterium]
MDILEKYKITGITCDSRKVKKGNIFVAIKGRKKDGNNYIKEAIKKGAAVVITDKKIKKNTSIPIIRVKDAREYLGKLAAGFYQHPSKQIKVIGVTGTNGKTTTTHLIYNLLNIKEKKCGLIGTVKVDTGKKTKKGNLTTPQAVILQQQLQEMGKQDLKYCSIEVSSHGVKLKRIKDVNFALKIGTNITSDHYDLHPNFSDYVLAKKEFLKTSNPLIPVLINGDDQYLTNFKKDISNLIIYGINNPSTIQAKNIRQKNNHTYFKYVLNKKLLNSSFKPGPCSFKIKMKLPGLHNIYNAIIAITIGLYYGLPVLDIKKFFRNYQGVWRRMQIIYNNKFKIIDDCAHNPGSYNAVFQTIKKMKYNNLYIINAIRGNRGQKINRENAEVISKQLQQIKDYKLFITNCRDTAGRLDKVKPTEEKKFLTVLNKKNILYEHYYYLRRCLQNVFTQIKKDDILLLLGAHPMDNAGNMALSLLKNIENENKHIKL